MKTYNPTDYECASAADARGDAWPFGAHQNDGRTAEEPRKGGWIQTYTGGTFWPMDPQPDDIRIQDIAHSLSMQCRYAGHCIDFYSVAEHSVLLAQWVFEQTGSSGMALWGLLHDAAEAYLVDVPRPLKPHLVGYGEAEARVMKAVRKRFSMWPFMPEIVREADTRILVDEREQNMSIGQRKWDIDAEPLGVEIEAWEPSVAKAAFLEAFDKYGGHHV